MSTLTHVPSRASAAIADVSTVAKLVLRGCQHVLAELHPSGRPLASRRAVRAAGAWWCTLSPDLVLVLGVPGGDTDVVEEVRERTAGEGVRVVDVTSHLVALRVMGSAARQLLTRAGAQALPAGAVRCESIDGIPTLVVHEDERRWLLAAPAADAAALWHALSAAGAPLGLEYVGGLTA